MSSKLFKNGVNNDLNTIASMSGSTGDMVSKTASHSIEALMKDVNLNETEKRVISEFVHLIDKSKQLFNGLRYASFFYHNFSASCFLI